MFSFFLLPISLYVPWVQMDYCVHSHCYSSFPELGQSVMAGFSVFLFYFSKRNNVAGDRC